MAQPYRQNISISCRVLMFLFYGTVISEKSYFSIGHAMLKYNSIKDFLIVRDVAFLVTCLAILASIFYEIYVKCSNLNYRIRLVREENEYKLKILDRATKNEDNVRRRKRTAQLTSFNDDIEPYTRGGGNSIEKQQRKLQPRIGLSRENTPNGLDSPKFSSLRRIKTDSHSLRSQSKASWLKRSSSKSKWQKESLLNEIFRDK